MKKILNIAIISLFALTLTGCGSKNVEVTCTKEGEKIVVNFENNKIVKLATEVTQTYDNESLLDMAYQSTQLTVSAYNAMNGANAEVTKNDNSIILKLTLDIPKMNKDDIDEDYYKQNPNKFIESSKQDGYSCTTK